MKCPHCKGRGVIELLTSTVPCSCRVLADHQKMMAETLDAGRLSWAEARRIDLACFATANGGSLPSIHAGLGAVMPEFATVGGSAASVAVVLGAVTPDWVGASIFSLAGRGLAKIEALRETIELGPIELVCSNSYGMEAELGRFAGRFILGDMSRRPALEILTFSACHGSHHLIDLPCRKLRLSDELIPPISAFVVPADRTLEPLCVRADDARR